MAISIKRKRLLLLLSIVVSLFLAVAGAATQSMLVGSFFGFVLALSIDALVETYKKVDDFN